MSEKQTVENMLQNIPMWTVEPVQNSNSSSGWQSWLLISQQLFLNETLIHFYLSTNADRFVITDLDDHLFSAVAAGYDCDDAMLDNINDLHADSMAVIREGAVVVDWIKGQSPYSDMVEAMHYGLLDAMRMVMHLSYKLRMQRYLENKAKEC